MTENESKWSFAFSSKSVLYICCSVIFLHWRLRNKNTRNPLHCFSLESSCLPTSKAKGRKKEPKVALSSFSQNMILLIFWIKVEKREYWKGTYKNTFCRNFTLTWNCDKWEQIWPQNDSLKSVLDKNQFFSFFQFFVKGEDNEFY